MADDPRAPDQPSWPLPRFCFQVDGGGGGGGSYFQEVAGLDVETQAVEYRPGTSKEFSPSKLPGLPKVGPITLKKSIFVQGDKFRAWYSTSRMNAIRRRTVVIKLLDETGSPAMTWVLHNAWPTKGKLRAPACKPTATGPPSKPWIWPAKPSPSAMAERPALSPGEEARPAGPILRGLLWFLP